MTEGFYNTLTVQTKDGPKAYKIRLKVHNADTKEDRYVRVSEAKSWDWHNQEIWRVINGWQITSYNKLLSMLISKVEQGQDEIELLEVPRFMMLSGG